MRKKGSEPDPTPPDGWITRAELVAATRVSDRNLLNWCAEGFIPRPIPPSHRGVPGAAGFYRAESVAMIGRLYELQQERRDANGWLWGLWLDPADYPVDLRAWTLRRLNDALKLIDAVGEDPAEIERSVESALRRQRAARMLQKRGVDPSALRDLALWAYRVAADIEQQERLDNPGSPILDTLRRVAGLPEEGFPAPDRKLGIESSAIGWFHEIVEKASAEEFAQLRRDCRAIDDLAKVAARINWHSASPAIRSAVRLVTGEAPEPRSIRNRKEARKRPPVPDIVRFLLSMWDDWDIRAILIAGLLVIRKSPEHGNRLTEILSLAMATAELATRLPETAVHDRT